MINVEEIKKRIIAYIQENGPSLPVKIAKAVQMEPVFASAIVSELTSSHQLKTSKMKVGASQLYLIKGQENQLEPFAEEYFKNIEKRAYLSLKEEKYLIDQNQEPAIRVALRNIKDFATPFKYQEKIMWRYNFTPKEEILRLLTSNKKIPKESNQQQTDSEQQSENIPNPEPEITQKPNQQAESVIEPQEKTYQEPRESLKEEPPPEPKEKSEEIKSKTLFIKPSYESPFNKSKETIPFSDEVKDFIQKKGITLIEKLEESRNEFTGIIQINSDLGKIKYLLIARNKKAINDQDIIVAHQKSSEHKMPCYFIHKGKIAKKSLETIEQYKNLIKIQTM